jgi:hypothetical protein
LLPRDTVFAALLPCSWPLQCPTKRRWRRFPFRSPQALAALRCLFAGRLCSSLARPRLLRRSADILVRRKVGREQRPRRFVRCGAFACCCGQECPRSARNRDRCAGLLFLMLAHRTPNSGSAAPPQSGFTRSARFASTAPGSFAFPLMADLGPAEPGNRGRSPG